MTVLARALGPLVHLIQAIGRTSPMRRSFPVTAFGFRQGGAARTTPGERLEAPRVGGEPFGDEPIWLLKEGEAPQRRTTSDTLFLWSLLLGLMNLSPAGRRTRMLDAALSGAAR